MEKLTSKKLTFFAYGGYDMCDEWQSSGKYYVSISKGRYGLRHNYFANVYPKRSRTGIRANGWHVSIYMCFKAPNSNDVKIESTDHKTLKEAKGHVCNFIANYDLTEQPDNILQGWCKAKAHPIFAIEDSIVNLIGVSYRPGVLADIQTSRDKDERDRWLYYNNHPPNYDNYRDIYILKRKDWADGSLCVSRVQYGWDSYTGSPVIDDQDLINKMVALIAGDSRFAQLLNPN